MATKNIVPRADLEGGLGTASKRWGSGSFQYLTNASTIGGSHITGSFTGSFIGDGANLSGITSGIFRTTGSFEATTADLQITGSVTASGGITASAADIAGNLEVGGQLNASSVSDGFAAVVVAEIDNDEIPIAKLAEDAVTITAGDGLKTGGAVTLGSSVTIDVDVSDFAGTGLKDEGSENLGIDFSDSTFRTNISGSFTATSASLAADVVTNAGNIGTTTNALTVDNATLQLNSGTTFNGSAARTISIKDGGVDSDALAANILVTQLTSSIISASSTVTANSFTGNGLSIDGSSNSHIEVGEYNVGFDIVASNTVFITGSGLIVSGAMADQNHHNMVKIGNVELLDVNTLLSQNEFLIHNVS